MIADKSECPSRMADQKTMEFLRIVCDDPSKIAIIPHTWDQNARKGKGSYLFTDGFFLNVDDGIGIDGNVGYFFRRARVLGEKSPKMLMDGDVAVPGTQFVDIDNDPAGRFVEVVMALAGSPVAEVLSGGGAHLYYRIRDCDNGDLLDTLSEWIDGNIPPSVKAADPRLNLIDTAVRNPSRMSRLPGTVNPRRGTKCELTFLNPSPITGGIKTARPTHPILPCVQYMVLTGAPGGSAGHLARIAIAASYMTAGMTPVQAAHLFLKCGDYDYSTSLKHCASLVGKPKFNEWGCRKMAESFPGFWPGELCEKCSFKGSSGERRVVAVEKIEQGGQSVIEKFRDLMVNDGGMPSLFNDPGLVRSLARAARTDPVGFEGAMVAAKASKKYSTEDLKSLRRVINKAVAADTPENQPSKGKRGGDAKERADWILSRHKFLTVKETDEILVYENGIYEPLGEPKIREELEAEEPEITHGEVNEVVEKVRRRTYCKYIELNPDPDIIVLGNGVLEIQNLTFRPWNPDDRATVKVDVNYDPAARCPEIDRFLSSTLHPDNIPTATEMLGYCLVKRYLIQKGFIFVGEGANGKSTLLTLFTRFLGQRNISSVALHTMLEDRFASADLAGKLANIMADLPDEMLVQTGTFKILTGGDVIRGQKKYGQPFDFVNFAKLMFSANRLPPVKDESFAFFRRWILIDFPNKFTGEREIKGYADRLATPAELSGLLNHALEGIRRLRANGNFTNCGTEEEMRELYIRMSDPVAAFAADMLVLSPEGQVPRAELYAAYREYCRERKLPSESEKSFYKDLPFRISVGETTMRRREDNRSVRAFTGIAIAGEREDAGSQPQIQPGLDRFVAPDRDRIKTVYDLLAGLVEENLGSPVTVERLAGHAASIGIPGEEVSAILDNLVHRDVAIRLDGGKVRTSDKKLPW